MRSVRDIATGLVRARRTAQTRPTLLPRATLPPRLLQRVRPITIQAGPPSAADERGDGTAASSSSSSSSGPNFEIVDDGPSSSGSAGSSSQHPFSAMETDANPHPETESSILPARIPGASGLPQPPELSEVPWTRVQHPFDTHAFVSYLEKAGLNTGTSTTLMEAVRKMIVTRGDRTRDAMMAKEDMENTAYLFRAALSELRTELSVKARNDGTALKTMAGAIRREVDSLEQKMKEDIQTLKHDIEMDMNNRNAENRSELKNFDISIEEINNKFTISLGDLRTEIESAKWDATRRAIAIIAIIVATGVAVTLFTTDSGAATVPPPAAVPLASTAPAMRDMAVGTDEEPFDPDAALSEEKLEKLLKESGVQVGKERPRRKDKPKDKDLHVDRI